MHRQVLVLWRVLKHHRAAVKSRLTGEGPQKLLRSLLEKLFWCLEVGPEHVHLYPPCVSCSRLQCWPQVFVCGLCWWVWAHVTEVFSFPSGSWIGINPFDTHLAPVVMPLAWPCLYLEAKHCELWRPLYRWTSPVPAVWWGLVRGVCNAVLTQGSWLWRQGDVRCKIIICFEGACPFHMGIQVNQCVLLQDAFGGAMR